MKIKRLLWLVVICAPAAVLAQAGHFDGNWNTSMACDASSYMPAYKWTFVSTVTNGVLHGQHGEQGGPGYMVIDGPIKADGSAKLHAKGTLQRGKGGLITQLKGEKYDYNVEAKFTETTGTGKRDEGAGVLGRPCSFEFTKQTDAPPAAPAAAPAQ